MPSDTTKAAQKITVELTLDDVERIVDTLFDVGEFHQMLAAQEGGSEAEERKSTGEEDPTSPPGIDDTENCEMPPLYQEAFNLYLLASSLKKAAIAVGDTRYRDLTSEERHLRRLKRLN